MQVSFGGKAISKPGAYSVVNTVQQTVLSAGALRVLLLIGAANGGQPQKVLYFNDPTSAKQVLRGGDLLNGANFAWQPAKAGFGKAPNGADLIAVVRTDTAAQATLVLKDSTTGTGVTLTSLIYGADGAKTTVTVGAGTQTNTQKVVFTDPAGILPTETYDNLPNATSIFQTFVNAVNGVSGAASNFFSAVIGTSTDTKFGTGTFTPTGGTQTAGASTDFANALTLAQSEAIDGIVALTSDQSIQAMVQSHVDTMSNVTNKKERRAFTGSAAGETVAVSKTNAAAFSDSRMVYVRPGGYRTINGTKTLFPGYMVACALAGMWAGGAPQDSVTYKYLNINDIETVDSADDINASLNAGVTPIEKVIGGTGGFRIVQGLTTSTAQSLNGGPDLAQQLLEIAGLMDTMTKDFRTNVQNRFTGQPGTSTTVAQMTSFATTLLDGYVSNGWLVMGFNPSTGKQDLAAYTSPVVQQNGNQYTISWQGRPSEEIDFELIEETFLI